MTGGEVEERALRGGKFMRKYWMWGERSLLLLAYI